MPNQDLYPAIEPFSSQYIERDHGHKVYVEQCGNPQGEPILFVHGGPGGGCSVRDRQFFDPKYFHIILFDQRGCGRSLPHAELTANTTADLIADMERIRETFAIDTWHLFGGSWGSTLSLLYAQAYPARVKSLTLRGIWLARQKDIDWAFNAGGAQRIFPKMWAELIEAIGNAPTTTEQALTIVEKAYAVMTGDDAAHAHRVAKAWARWEINACTLVPNQEYLAEATADKEAWTLARHEAHFMLNKCFIAENQIIHDIDKLSDIPCTIVHGRYDMICPVDQAILLSTLLPQSTLVIAEDAGHASIEPTTMSALVKATDQLRL